MADQISAGKTSDFVPGEMKILNVGGEQVAVARVGDEYFAFRNECTHQNVQLADGFGELEGRRIHCALHDSSFDVKNGRVTGGPAFEPLKTFPVSIEGDDVMVGEGG